MGGRLTREQLITPSRTSNGRNGSDSRPLADRALPAGASHSLPRPRLVRRPGDGAWRYPRWCLYRAGARRGRAAAQNAVVRTSPGGDFLPSWKHPGPGPEELLSLSRAAVVAGLGARTLQTAIRRGNLSATKLAPGAREWFIRRSELHRYLMSRRRGSPAPLPAEYVPPRGPEQEDRGG